MLNLRYKATGLLVAALIAALTLTPREPTASSRDKK